MSKEVKVESEANIAKEVFKVGGIVFLISSLIPSIVTINFFIRSFPINYTLNGYGEWQFGISLGMTITAWLICVPTLTLPAMLGKFLLFKVDKKTVFLMPILTLILAIVFYFVGSSITMRLS